MTPPILTVRATGNAGELAIDLASLPGGYKARIYGYIDDPIRARGWWTWPTLLGPGAHTLTGLVNGETYGVFAAVEDESTGDVLSAPSNLEKAVPFSSTVHQVILKREPVVTYEAYDVLAYRLRISVLSVQNMPRDIFLYRKESVDGLSAEEREVFVCVCSAADLEQFPVGTPQEGEPPFYRKDSIDVVIERLGVADDEETINNAWTDVRSAATALEMQLNDLDRIARLERYDAQGGVLAEPSLSSVSLSYSSASSGVSSSSSSSSEQSSLPSSLFSSSSSLQSSSLFSSSLLSSSSLFSSSSQVSSSSLFSSSSPVSSSSLFSSSSSSIFSSSSLHSSSSLMSSSSLFSSSSSLFPGLPHIFTDTNQFKALTNCSISSGVIPAYWNFMSDDTGTGLVSTEWTTVNATNGTADITTHAGNLTLTCNANNPTNFDQGLGIQRVETTTGNFEFITWLPVISADANYESSAVIWIIDSKNYVVVEYNYGGSNVHKSARFWIWKAGGIFGTVQVVGEMTYTQGGLRLVRSGDVFSGYYKLNEGDSWTQIGSSLTPTGIGTAGYIRIMARPGNTSGNLAPQFDYAYFVSGFQGTATAQIRDPGVLYADMGEGRTLDFSTQTEDVSGAPTLEYRYYASNNSGDTPIYGIYMTPTLFRAKIDDSFRYYWLRVRFTSSSSADVMNSFTVWDYPVDVHHHAFSNTLQFKALTNCSIDNAVIPGYWNFSNDDTGTGLNDWSTLNGTNGTADVTTNVGKLTLTCNANNPAALYLGLAVARGEQNNSDFDVSTWLSVTSVDANYERSGFMYYIDNNNWVAAEVNYGSAGVHKAVQFFVIKGGALVGSVQVVGEMTYTAIGLRFTRSGDTFAAYYRLTELASWTQVGSSVTSTGIGTAGILRIYAYPGNTSGNLVPQYDHCEFNTGFAGTATAQMRDVGVLYTDMGAGNTLDFSTAAEYLNGSPTVTYRYDSSDDPAHSPSYGSYLTLAQFQAEAENAHRYQWLQVKFASSNMTDVLEGFTVEDTPA